MPVDGLDLGKLDDLELGDLLSDAELRHMDIDTIDTPTGPGGGGGNMGSHFGGLGSYFGSSFGSGGGGGGKAASLPPLPAIDLSLLAPQKVAPPPSRPARSSWCSWPTE